MTKARRLTVGDMPLNLVNDEPEIIPQVHQTKAQAIAESNDLIRQIMAFNQANPQHPLRKLSHGVCVEANALLSNPRKYNLHHPDVDNIRIGLNYTLTILKDNHDTATIHKLKHHAKTMVYGKPNHWQKFSGVLLLVVGAVLIGLSSVAIPFTGGLSGIAIAGGAGMFASGIGLIQRGSRKSLSAELHSFNQKALKMSRT